MDNRVEVDSTVRSLFTDLKNGHDLRCKLSFITEGLKLYEKISVIFLLCKNSDSGLKIMESILRTPDTSTQNNLFYKWLRDQFIFKNSSWLKNLAEVLSIIQNYKLAKILGFSKNKSKEFMPKNNLKSFNVLGIRKVLYNLCEKLFQEETGKLKSLIGKEHSAPHLKKCLEFHLLLWSKEKLINLDNDEKLNLHVLVDSLKFLKLNDLVNDIETVVEKTNCKLVRSKSVVQLEANLFNYYQVINDKNLGLCVIISEKNFTVKELFPKRFGSDKDVHRLVEVFTSFGFDIRVHVDLTYKNLIQTLTNYAENVDENISFFVLIILSHGSENVIYTSDSLPIDMNAIEMIFQAEFCPRLIGKPKIFIIQSCQGEKWQKVFVKTNESDIESDNSGLLKSNEPLTLGPQRGDSMIAWSTVQGFASFRDKYHGSWYIQELCKELWKYGDTFDLVEIFTRVNNNLRSKLYGGQFMVPSLLLSLRAKVKFPQLEQNLLRGKKLMLERLIFEKFFRDFLTDRGSFELISFLQGH